jgi:protein-S-isoprenylcysteine O-methyltransferase Ste14
MDYSRLGGWAFRQRSWLPVPLALVLVFVRWRESDSAWVVAAGAALVIAGLAVRLWGVRHIGTISRTRATRQGPLITSGPYAFVRNPLYVGNALLWTGFVLLARLLWMLPVAGVVFAVQYGSIAAWEEARLRGHYGADYDAYARVVPRWVPSLRTLSGARGSEGLRRPGEAREPRDPHPWSDVLFSERGTLLAAGVMTVLLIVKQILE